MSTAAKTAPFVILENRHDPITIGLDPTMIERIEEVADTVSATARDYQSKYGFDNVLKSDEGTPYDALDGAAAFYRAILKLTGSEPIGQDWGPNPPIMRDLQVQEFRYTTPEGDFVTDSELANPAEWGTQRLHSYLAGRGVEVPAYFSEDDRPALLAKLMPLLTLVGAPVKTIYVPWGAVKIPGFKGVDVFVTEEDGEDYGYNRPVFRLAVLAKKKQQAKVDEVVQAVKDELKHHSIYKARCYYYNDGSPVFFDPFTVAPEEIILPASLQARLDNELMSVINHRDYIVARKEEIDQSLLRGRFLLAGQPGTGKTEYTKIVAQSLLKNGITACFMKAGTKLEEVQRFMARVSPAYGILEDVEAYFPDEDASKKEQKLERSALTALFDGSLSKGQEVAWLLTTNFPLLFDEAMSRQGRVDGYFVFSSLDAAGFERLVRMKLGERIADDVDFAAVWNEAGEMSSAFLGGLVKIAMKYTLGKTDHKLTTSDLLHIVLGLRAQWEWHVELGALESSKKERTVREEMNALLAPIVDASLTRHLTSTVK